MNIRVRLFAILKQQAGRDSLELDLPSGATVSEAVEVVGQQAQIVELLRSLPLAHAVNREYVEPSFVLDEGDELVLVPPVSGGAGPAAEPRIHAAVVQERLSADRLTDFVADPAAGALVVFHGVTREVDRLEYEAFVEMAEPLLAEILAAIAGEYSLTALACEHRFGAVALGESSVVVAASAPHRPEAFAGARAAIDRIKLELPIWKREVVETSAGEQSKWVEGALPGRSSR